MYSSSKQCGSRGDVTAVDGEAVLAELSQGKFATSTDAGTYSPEMLTTTYIASLFDALKNVEEFWKKCVSHARNYIENFENIPMPESFPDDSGFLDEVDYSENISATVTGVTTSLNVRSGASTSSNVVGSLAAGSKISSVLGEEVDSSGKKWYKIKTADGKEGYVSSDYVSVNKNSSPTQTNNETNSKASSVNTSKSQDTSTAQNTSVDNLSTTGGETSNKNEKKYANVKLDNASSHLNVRSTPDSKTTGNVLTQLNDKSKIEILGETVNTNGEKWYKIKTADGKEGFVSSSYISVDKQTSSAASTINNISSSNNQSSATTESNVTNSNFEAKSNTAVNKNEVNLRKFADVNLENANSHLNFRSTPDSSGEKNILSQLNNKTTVEILEQSDDNAWSKVRLSNGQEGYVATKYLKM